MAQVVRLEIEDSGYQFTFAPVPRTTGSMKPQLVATADLKANIEDLGKDVLNEIKRRAFALAAIIFNKFKRWKCGARPIVIPGTAF